MARILVGSLNDPPRQNVPVEKISPLYAQYGWLAAKAYNDGLYGLETQHKAGVDECEGEKDCPVIKRKIMELQAIWGAKPVLAAINDCSEGAKPHARRDFGHDGMPGDCNENDPAKHRILDGLGIQIWARQGRDCPEMVIAFRGTDFSQSDDWLSNLRWITRILPLYDQYEQSREHLDRLVARAIKLMGCMPKKITTVGHSLGGGLAQHAAYAQKSRLGRPPVSRVYAFDPSFVTGYYDRAIDAEAKRKAVAGLKIDRIYEHGELLAYPRFVLRHVYPPAACNPQVRLVRFDFLEGSFVAQHNMASLVRKMLANTSSPLSRKPISETAILPPAPEAIGDTGHCQTEAAHASLNSRGHDSPPVPLIVTIVRLH